MLAKRPEINFLNTVATAIIDGEPVEAACFVLITEGKEPYVVQYGEITRSKDMMRALLKNLQRAVAAREELHEGFEPLEKNGHDDS